MKSDLNLKKIKYLVLGIVAFLVLTVAGCSSVTRIGVGHVGVKVKLAGSVRGVQDMQIKTGWVLFNPLTEQIIEFPTKVENITLTHDPHDGLQKGEKANPSSDESITFSSTEGVNVNSDIGFSFHIQPDMAPQLYSRFRQNDMRELAYGYMRNVVRDAFNETASKMSIQEIYGSGKSNMLLEVLNKCRDTLKVDGIIVDQVTIIGSLRLPKNVEDSINSAIAQTQRAIESENKVRQIKAEADQSVAAAQGQADSAKQKATGEAAALLIKTNAENEALISSAQSQAKANLMLSGSLTAPIIQYKALNTWDGKLPVYQGGDSKILIPIK